MRGNILRRGFQTLLLATVLFFILHFSQLLPAPLGAGVVFCLVLAAAVVGLVVTAAEDDEDAGEAEWYSPQPEPPGSTHWTSEFRTAHLRMLISSVLRDGRRSEQLHSTLRGLAEERLARRGVGLDADQSRAAQLMGRDLSDYLYSPPMRDKRLHQNRLAAIVQRIEEL